ncbi:hypothetical protein QBC44DRAFT_17198 [Cladorrhinum sp. PSN332]|nr:hypothetical protein QBC44DRAFT_17198 [Cladorrhinum sp. PSN332]
MDCRPRFFLIRKGIPNRIVPLIAVDELPEWINIIGCPRELKREETRDLYNLGAFSNKSKEPYAVEILPGMVSDTLAEKAEEVKAEGSLNGVGVEKEAAPPPPPPPPSSPVQSETKSAATAAQTTEEATSPPTEQAGTCTTFGSQPKTPIKSENITAQSSTTASKHAHSLPHLPTSPPPLKPLPLPLPSSSSSSCSSSPSPSTYCRHWINHGTCKYNRACKYKHEMPTSPWVLSALGLSEFPAWFTVGAAELGRSGSRRRRRKRREEESLLLVRELLGRRGGIKKTIKDKDEEDKDDDNDDDDQEFKVAMGRVEADLPIVGLKGGRGLGMGRLVDV